MSLAEFKALYWWEWSHRLLRAVDRLRFFFCFFFFFRFCLLLWCPRYSDAFHSAHRPSVCTWRRSGPAGLSNGEERPHVPRRRQPVQLAAPLMDLAVLIGGYALCLLYPWMTESEAATAGPVEAVSRRKNSLNPLLRGGARAGHYIQINILERRLCRRLEGRSCERHLAPDEGRTDTTPGLGALSPWYMNIFLKSPHHRAVQPPHGRFMP